MKNIIPTIYFYTLSAVGMVLIIVGLFNWTHFILGSTIYDKYPLQYAEQRCEMSVPKEADVKFNKEDCLKSVEKEREFKQKDDLEKAITFSFIGLGVFGTHFYLARKRK